MEKEIKELRSYDLAPSVSDDIESRHVEGYAAVFNQESEDLGFIEVLEPEAITDEHIQKDIVFCLLNHNQNKVLAVSKKGIGSLKLSVDERGLFYSFDAPKTQLGDELLEYIRRGDITQSSFAFVVDQQEWSKTSDGKYIRKIKKIKDLYDVSPVFVPAYSSTSVSADTRGLDELKSKEENERKAYYEMLKQEIK